MIKGFLSLLVVIMAGGLAFFLHRCIISQYFMARIFVYFLWFATPATAFLYSGKIRCWASEGLGLLSCWLFLLMFLEFSKLDNSFIRVLINIVSALFIFLTAHYSSKGHPG